MSTMVERKEIYIRNRNWKSRKKQDLVDKPNEENQ